MGKEEQGQADEVQKGVQREEKDAENGKWRILGITIVLLDRKYTSVLEFKLY